MKHLLLAALSMLLITGCAKKDEAADNKPEENTAARRAKAVKIMRPAMKRFEDRLEAQGSLEAKNFAEVSAKIEGTIEQILVQEGDKVVQDKTVLFITDTRKPLQNKQVAEQNLLVATENHKVALASVAKAKAQCEKARKDKDRYENLFKNGNVTENEKETYVTNFLVSDASLKLAIAQAQAAEAQMKQAKVSFEIAAKDLEDCSIKAPITGVVTVRHKEPGEHATKSSPVVRVEDTTDLEVSAFIPGRYFPKVLPGKTTLNLVAELQDAGKHPITYRADIIDTTLRTFEIKARLNNNDGKLAAGMLAKATIILDARQAIAVPTHSIIQRRQGFVIFVNENNVAKEVIVKTGLANEGMTEILAAEIQDGNARKPFKIDENTQVVMEGQALLTNGTPINVQQ